MDSLSFPFTIADLLVLFLSLCCLPQLFAEDIYHFKEVPLKF